MKSKLILALLGLAALFTGCNKESGEDFTASKGTTCFNVSVEGGVKSRAAVTDLTRYVMEVYQGATATGTPVMHKEQATGTFADVVLDNGQQYTVLFWADYGTPSANGTHTATNEYNAADLKAAVIAKQPTKAAYAGLSRFTIGTDNEATYTAVTLKHAVAQVSFKQTEVLTSATNTLVVKYPKSYSLNVDDNAVTEVAGEVTHTFTYNSKAIGTLGTSYIIAATGAPKTILDITATLNSETAKAVSNVPFERNYRTNISGAYSNKYDATLTATCEDAWGTPENEAEIPTTPAAGDFITVSGIKVAVGNLVADGANGAKIGAATDGGLYFQFSSLIGWSGSANADGTGRGDNSVAGAVVVSPVGYEGSTTWNGNWVVLSDPSADPNANDVKTGKGDPCRYYLKGSWRLPTNDELRTIFDVSGFAYRNGWSWDATTKAASHTSGLKLPASGNRSWWKGNVIMNYLDTKGYYWSSTPTPNVMPYPAYIMSFDASYVDSSHCAHEQGLTVRCVCD